MKAWAKGDIKEAQKVHILSNKVELLWLIDDGNSFGSRGPSGRARPRKEST
jgi:hypothetical protein